MNIGVCSIGLRRHRKGQRKHENPFGGQAPLCFTGASRAGGVLRRLFCQDTSTWLAAKNNDLTDYLKKLELVDEVYRNLLTDEARELLDSAGCENVEITWGSDPVEPVEAIMQAAGLRG